MSFLKRIFHQETGPAAGLLKLDFPSPPPRPPQPQPPKARPDPVPGRFMSFGFLVDLPIAGVVHESRPKTAIRDTASEQVHWGESLADMARGDPDTLRVRWIDDPVRGIDQRTIVNPEDVLGAEGTLGDKHLRFERILDLGQNVIVYALFCPEQNFRLAYGWNREAFQPTYTPPPRISPTPS